jgi:hypothetical protein
MQPCLRQGAIARPSCVDWHAIPPRNRSPIMASDFNPGEPDDLRTPDAACRGAHHLCRAVVGLCQYRAGGQPCAKSAPTMASAMAEADAAVLAGQNDKAYAILKNAGTAFPTDKTPWVRMAQMHFDSTNYGEAIVDALEALERDPDDTLANSIVAVSGLRVTSKALADLSQKNNLTATCGPRRRTWPSCCARASTKTCWCRTAVRPPRARRRRSRRPSAPRPPPVPPHRAIRSARSNNPSTGPYHLERHGKE